MKLDNINRFMKEQKGVGTIVEYSIVLPIVLGVVFLLLVFGYAQFQKGVIESATQRASLNMSRFVSNPSYYDVIGCSAETDCETSAISFNITGGETKNPGVSGSSFDFSSQKNEPYRYFFNVNPSTSQTIEFLKANINNYTLKKNLFSNLQTDVKTTGFIFKTAKTSSSQKFQSPIKVPVFGSPGITITSQAYAGVVDNPEMIRNVDLAIGYINGFLNKIGAQEKFNSSVKPKIDNVIKMLSP